MEVVKTSRCAAVMQRLTFITVRFPSKSEHKDFKLAQMTSLPKSDNYINYFFMTDSIKFIFKRGHKSYAYILVMYIL